MKKFLSALLTLTATTAFASAFHVEPTDPLAMATSAKIVVIKEFNVKPNTVYHRVSSRCHLKTLKEERYDRKISVGKKFPIKEAGIARDVVGSYRAGNYVGAWIDMSGVYGVFCDTSVKTVGDFQRGIAPFFDLEFQEPVELE